MQTTDKLKEIADKGDCARIATSLREIASELYSVSLYGEKTSQVSLMLNEDREIRAVLVETCLRVADIMEARALR